MHPLSTDWRALSNNLHSVVERDSLRVLVRKRSFVFVFIRFPASEYVAPSRRAKSSRQAVESVGPTSRARATLQCRKRRCISDFRILILEQLTCT